MSKKPQMEEEVKISKKQKEQNGLDDSPSVSSKQRLELKPSFTSRIYGEGDKKPGFFKSFLLALGFPDKKKS